jgi:hypothetical protein
MTTLNEIRARRQQGETHHDDFDWLLGEVERLRAAGLAAIESHRQTLDAYRDLCEERDRERDRAERAERERDAALQDVDECQQIAGKALGYPWYKDDQKNFPNANDANGVCIGEHCGSSIVQELANALVKRRELCRRAERERDAAREEIRLLKLKLQIVTDPDLDCEIGTPTPSERESTPRQQDKGEPG